MRKRTGQYWVGLLAGAAAACPSSQAHAQQSAEPVADEGSSGEIVVTARKREETLLSVPVTVTAMDEVALRNRGITDLEGVARAVPQLFIGAASGSIQGGVIGLRGVSSGDGNAFGDQAVAFNFDGVQIARSTPRRLSQFDLRQVEVLKGPQALYYGKNSPGGIVVIRTADPTDRLETGAIGSYEFNAREFRGEAFLSGPLAESLGARVALYGSTMRGWVDNIAGSDTIYAPAHGHEPNSDEYGGRVTLKFDNHGAFTARFKFNYGKVKNSGVYANTQLVSCPSGVGALSPRDDCSADDGVSHGGIGPRFGSGGTNTVTGTPLLAVPLFGDGDTYSTTQQYLSGLELGYQLTDTLSLAAVTGFYDARSRQVDNANGADAAFAFNPALGPAGPGGLAATAIDFKMRELSQELRLTSSFDGPVNFMLGGHYQDQDLSLVQAAALNALNPIQAFPPFRAEQGTNAYSVFGSTSIKPIATIEISGGLRYSHEKKDFAFYRLLAGKLPGPTGTSYQAGDLVPSLVPERSFHNVSPEVTLSWRPSDRMTAYFGWRRGFLSGGFNPTGTGSNVAILPDRTFGQEVVEGFEGGIKGVFLNGALRASLAAYSYKVDGLQVTALVGDPPQQVTNNAAGARSKGLELDTVWTMPVTGLTLRGGAAYNRARYSSFETSPCYAGQTIAAGCSLLLNSATGRFTAQDLSGAPLVRAPKWGAVVGANFDRRLGNGDQIGLSYYANYTSGFFTDALNSPESYHRGYWLLDASARYSFAQGFEVAVLGRNLTNKYYFQKSADNALTGGASGVASSVRADTVAYVSRGREIAVRLSYRFR